jgi:hypothetical protein
MWYVKVESTHEERFITTQELLEESQTQGARPLTQVKESIYFR